MAKIILTGFMGTGKTAVGCHLAGLLQLPFLDLDTRVEKLAGKSVREIFSADGEETFRELERRAVAELIEEDSCVVATGGGTVIDPANRRILRGEGFLVGLSADIPTLLERLSDSRYRPLLSGPDRRQQLEELLHPRESAYRDVDIHIDTTGKSVAEIAALIVTAFHDHEEKRRSHPVTAITVNLGLDSYPLYVGRGILSTVGEHARHAGFSHTGALISHPRLMTLYGKEVQASLERAGFDITPIEVPEGETEKSWERVGLLYQELSRVALDRFSALFALGGGVVGDLVGFVAATFLRGVPLVHLPTSLTAQVDSSIGGKTGINLPLGKNLVGAFYQPRFVLTDVATLASLPEREFVSGLAEVVKYAIIRDAELFRYLEENTNRLLRRDQGALLHTVTSCCAIKAQIVEKDERDHGLRAILNFGHTVGHAIESALEYREIQHGEAISVGMLVATQLSVTRGICPRKDLERVSALLQRCGLPRTLPVSPLEIMKRLFHDKKVRDGVLHFVLTGGIGHASVSAVADPQEILEVLESQGISPH